MKEISKTKLIIMNTFALIFTTLISFIICYIYLDDIFVPMYIQTFGRISFRLFISFILFICINWVLNKKISNIYQKILFILYFILLISFALSRNVMPSSINNINLKLGYIDDLSKMILFANIFMYIPIGLFIKKFYKIKALYSLIIFLIYIIILETIQYIMKVGYFDVNDILLNSFGFMIGLLIYSFIKKTKFKFLRFEFLNND